MMRRVRVYLRVWKRERLLDLPLRVPRWTPLLPGSTIVAADSHGENESRIILLGEGTTLFERLIVGSSGGAVLGFVVLIIFLGNSRHFEDL
jgi:hypothetical protein